jgi:hypothetical protein
MSTNLAKLKEKTERYLKDVVDRFEVVVESYRVRYGSTVVSIEPEVWNEEEDTTILRMIAVVLTGVKRSGNQAMFEDLSRLNDTYRFGKFYWTSTEDNEDEGIIFVEQQMLGEYMDFEEFKQVLISLAYAADEVDDELQVKYGGERWVDYQQQEGN